MMQPKDAFDAAKVILGIAAAASASSVTGGAEKLLGSASLLTDLIARLRGKTNLLTRVQQNLETQLAAQPDLKGDDRLLILQMIELARPAPAEIIGAGRRPVAIVTLMLARLSYPEHCRPAIQGAFHRVAEPVLTDLLADKATSDDLRPAFEDFVADRLRHIAGQIDLLADRARADAHRLGVQEGMLISLARRYVPGDPQSFDTALKGLEAALETAARMQAQGQLPQNTGDPVDRVIAEVNRLNVLERLDDAADEITKALQDEQKALKDQQAASEARQIALLDMGVDQDRLRNNPASAAGGLLQRLALDNPQAGFAALRALQDEWYVSGRDKGLNFDAEVAVHLARHSISVAQTGDERGMALNDLAVALANLGERESGAARLAEAVEAYREALKEQTRDRVPLDWAQIQFNLAIIDRAFFDLTADPVRLASARAYALAAREFYGESGAAYNVEQCDSLLAKIGSLAT